MYESPINLVMQDIERRMFQEEREQTEQTILNAIRKCGVYVNKEEFIKAMNYDRNQYSKGYKDGFINALDKIRVEIIELRSRQNVGVLECLDIIDKYKKESEE